MSFKAQLRFFSVEATLFSVCALLPVVELMLPTSFAIAAELRVVFIFSILALGMHLITGMCGVLNLGMAGFMAIGAYAFGILTTEIYPFQLGFAGGLLCATLITAFFSILLGVPTLRLRGDYLAVVTLGFAEIVQDALRNLEVITQGTQGLNPLPAPSFFQYSFTAESPLPWYYLFLVLLVLCTAIAHLIERSNFGRALVALREDELAARVMGVRVTAMKLWALAGGAAFAGAAGALWASFLGSTGEPGNYDFQISVLLLCAVIVGGLGSIRGALIGTLVMMGFSSILLTKLTTMLAAEGAQVNPSVIAHPSNWKYMLLGMALILTMRLRPQGFFPPRTFGRPLEVKVP